MNMDCSSLRDFESEILSWKIVDSHTHIDWLSPYSTELWDILGYHYYTELAHSCGMKRIQIESSEWLSNQDRLAALISYLPAIENTQPVQWLEHICKTVYDWHDKINIENFRELDDRIKKYSQQENRLETLVASQGIRRIFMTNSFSDVLPSKKDGFYVPFLRADDIVNSMFDEKVRMKVQSECGYDIQSERQVYQLLRESFEKFSSAAFRGCALALPPEFKYVKEGDIGSIHSNLPLTDNKTSSIAQVSILTSRALRELCRKCMEYNVPIFLMLGASRGLYSAGVRQGQDLLSMNMDIHSLAMLFNAFPDLKFVLSVLADSTQQQLLSYTWIFPNVYISGHWWYSNLPIYIETSLTSRLQGLPSKKIIGYYSDAFKLEFVRPKYQMYIKTLSKVVFNNYVLERSWSENSAMELARNILIENTKNVFEVA